MVRFTYGKTLGFCLNVPAISAGYVQPGSIGRDVWSWMGVRCFLRCPCTTICSILGRNLAANVGADCRGILGLYAGFAKKTIT
jgi:hypothetical protein